jgi:hypothetical protein
MLSKVSKAIRATPARQWFCASSQGKPTGTASDGQAKSQESDKQNPYVKKANQGPNRNQNAANQSSGQETQKKEAPTFLFRRKEDKNQPQGNKQQGDQKQKGERSETDAKQTRMFNFKETDFGS